MRVIGNLVAATFISLLFTSYSLSQVGNDLRYSADANGLIVTGPASGQRFEMRIDGENVSRMRTTKKYWFTANGIGFEFFSEENSKFLITDIPHRLNDRAVLKLYLAGFMHRNANPKIEQHWMKLAGGQTALYWSYNKFVASPNHSSDNNREMFLVVAGPGHVFGLFAPVRKEGSERETRQLLIRVLGTLTFSE